MAREKIPPLKLDFNLHNRFSWIGYDSTGLAILGIFSFLRGCSYTPSMVDPGRKPAHFMESLLEPPSWAVVWIAIALFCFVAIWQPRFLRHAVGVSVGLHTLWALSFSWATWFGDLDRAWVSGLGYGLAVSLTIFAYSRVSPKNVNIGGETLLGE